MIVLELKILSPSPAISPSGVSPVAPGGDVKSFDNGLLFVSVS
jgi:hypothetical protein